MQENKSSNKQNEKIKDTVVQASKIKVDAKNDSKQASKVGTKVQDKKQIGIPVALIATILVIAILGMTAYARFRSRIGGQGTAPVAEWSFKVNGSTASISSFDLGTTRNDANGKVADGVIAPGTSGNFDIEIDGTGSQVAIEYSIEIDASNMPTNLKLYRDENHTKKIEDASRKAIIQGYIDLANINTKVKETIYWEWPYRTGETEEEKLANDRIDTQEMEQNMGQTVELPIKVVGIQSNPNEQDLSQAGIEIVNAKEGEYSAGDVITLQANYSDNIYASSSQEAITSETAPVMTIKFGDGAEKQMTFSEVVQGTDSGAQANIETKEIMQENEKAINKTEEGIEVASKEKINLANIEKSVRIASNNASSIKYTYTVTEEDDGAMQIVSYTGTVYSKKGKAVQVVTKALEGGSNITVKNTENLADVVSVGDIVNYNANVTDESGNAYTITPSKTGYYVTTTFSSADSMTWKVLNVDKSTKTVELMAITPKSISFSNVAGYNNAPTILGEIAKIYGHGYGAEGTRSMTVEDVDQYTSYDKMTYSNSNSSTGKYGGTKAYTFYSKLSYPFTVEGAKRGATSDVTISSSGRNTVPQTYYNYTISSYKKTGISDSVYSMLTAGDYWLASRSCDLYSEYCCLVVRKVYSGAVDGGPMFSSAAKIIGDAVSTAPVITLKPNIQTTGQDESGIWQLK